MLDKRKFIEILSTVAEIYGKDLSENAINIYYSLLQNYSFEQLSKAFTQILRTNKYNCFPKPAEIIELIEGREEDRAIMAWESVRMAIQKYGYTSSVEFEDKTIHLCIENLGGWQWLCSQTTEELKFIMKDFIKMYKTFRKYKPRQVPKRLLGFIEEKNLQGGYYNDIPPTIFIGQNKEIKRISIDK